MDRLLDRLPTRLAHGDWSPVHLGLSGAGVWRDGHCYLNGLVDPDEDRLAFYRQVDDAG